VDEINPATALWRTRPARAALPASPSWDLRCRPIPWPWSVAGSHAKMRRRARSLRCASSRASAQGSSPDATGYKGFYYHFLDMQSGKRVWQCEVSPIDTALLFAGVLTAGAYFTAATSDEAEIRALARELYGRIDWDWARNGNATVAQGWKPECGFLHYGWQGYNEAALLYVLGLASPTHPLPATSYAAWTATYQWERIYGCDLLYAGPLFVHQFSHAWIDFRKIQDSFMREKGSDYFENSCRAVDVQREYARRDPNEYGTMASTAGASRRATGRGSGRCASADGSAASSNTPRAACRSVRTTGRSPPWRRWRRSPLLRRTPCRRCVTSSRSIRSGKTPGGCRAASTGSLRVRILAGGSRKGSYGLDQGLAVLMIENHRSGLIWKLMRDAPLPSGPGLKRAGFRGGWL
jgi:hypothetical protein